MIIQGRVHKFGDNINTDDIIAAKYLDSQDAIFLGSKCMENIDPTFSKKVREGDIIVAGKNFGCGSSREHAPLAIKGCGISLVIAKSFARIFFRNSINIGLALLQCKDVDLIEEADVLRVDLSQGEIKILDKEKSLNSERFPLFLQEIINSGGLIPWSRKKIRKNKLKN